MDKFIAILVGVIVVLIVLLFATNMIQQKEEIMPEEAVVEEEVPAEEAIPEEIEPVGEEIPVTEEAVVEVKEEVEEVTGKNCIDSDGMDYFTAGYATFYKSKYYDKCTTSTQIFERYCEGDQIRAVVGTCANGCENGACRSEELPAKETICFDSDNGLNYDVYGYVEFGGNMYRDGCTTTSLVKENYCENNKPYVKSYLCSYGCESGACKKEEVVTEEKKCIDSDNGFDYYTLGYVIYDGMRYDDRCTGSISLAERYCEDDKFKTRDYKCPDYCEDGVCVKTPVCGDAVRDEGEECDGYDFGGKTCVDYDYSSGSLLCSMMCKIKFDSCE